MSSFKQNPMNLFKRIILLFVVMISCFGFSQSKKENPKFKVIALLTSFSKILYVLGVYFLVINEKDIVYVNFLNFIFNLN